MTQPKQPLIKRLDLSALDNPLSMSVAGMETGQINIVLELSLSEIEEDSSQPRSHFAEEALNSLAESIAVRGVQQPITVRPKNSKGKYQIIQGARRFRASQLAGKTRIPAIVQKDESIFDDYAQVVENTQRENLSPMEIALFIKKRQEAGDKNKIIAKYLGEKEQYVTAHASLFKAPENLLSAFNEGRITGIGVFYELFSLHKKQPVVVDELLSGDSEITLSMVRATKQGQKNHQLSEPENLLDPAPVSALAPRDETIPENNPSSSVEITEHTTDTPVDISEPTKESSFYPDDSDSPVLSVSSGFWNGMPEPDDDPIDVKDREEGGASEPAVIQGGYHGAESEKKAPSSPPDPNRIKKPLLLGTHKGDPIKVLLQRKPSTPGLIHIQYADTMIDAEVSISEIQLTELCEMLVPEKG